MRKEDGMIWFPLWQRWIEMEEKIQQMERTVGEEKEFVREKWLQSEMGLFELKVGRVK